MFVSQSACMGVVATFTGTCNYANFANNLNLPNGCTSEGLFPVGATQAEKESLIANLCEYDAIVQFVEILGTYQDDRRYFAGGGDMVDSQAAWEVVTGGLQRFEDNLASDTLIAFPEYAARVKYNQLNNGGDNGYPANMNLEKSCGLKTVMCCFTDDGDGYNDGDLTTDVCRHDLRDSPQSNHIANGWSVFPREETPAHCVGFTWTAENADLVGNMLYDVSLRNTLTKGYKKGVPGAPMCGCIEHMPVVESAMCRSASKTGVVTFTFSVKDGALTASNAVGIKYEDCGDLAAKYKQNNPDSKDLINEHLVGTGGCKADIDEYLHDEHFLVEDADPKRYITPDAEMWEQAIGMGTLFLPPGIKPATADADFRAQISACKITKNRHCIIRRVCHSCTSPAHRDIYYKRLTDFPPFGTNTTNGEMYVLDMFMNGWASFENILNEDFEMYSTYQDALDGTNKWMFCNYDYVGHPVGFPRDCAPYSYTGDQWNSYTGWMPSAHHHGFFVEK